MTRVITLIAVAGKHWSEESSRVCIYSHLRSNAVGRGQLRRSLDIARPSRSAAANDHTSYV